MNLNDKRSEDIYFLPLGGTGEIGMNFNVYGYKGQWLVVDCGVTFKDHSVIGADVFMPNIDSLKEKNINVTGLLITHAHEDHIGAVHHLWPKLKCPIYCTPFSAHLLKQRLIDVGILDDVKLNIVKKETKFSVGNFKLELINVNHSILEPNAVLISLGKKRIFHTGDWKLDDKPNIGSKTNIKRLKEIGNEGVDVIVCDSTNANVKGTSGSENSIEKGLSKNMKDFKGRIFITMFASNVERIFTLIRLAGKFNREVGLIGRSMWRMTEAAKSVGYLDSKVKLVSEKYLRNLSDNKFLSICTGSQGEPLGALNRIADDTHPHINFKSTDRVIFSSRMIPGNEVSINNLMNKLIYKGIDVIVPKSNDIHVSGHPAEDELKLMYSWIKPKISIPVHGEAVHINAHADIAKKNGAQNVVKIKNGFLVNLSKNKGEVVDRFSTGKMALNGDEIISTEAPLFKERKKMLFNGIIGVNCVVSPTGDLQEMPRIKLLSVVSNIDQEDLYNISQFLEENIRPYVPIKRSNESELKQLLTKKTRKYMQNNFYKNPSIIIDIIYIET